jgi:small redox-active disulfide protein 2
MRTIKVLGTGCKRCTQAMDLITAYVAKNNMDYEVIKVSDLPEIMKYKVMTTPGIVVNEQVVHTGSVPAETQLKEWLAD